MSVTSFEQLDRAELYRSAIEDFAVPVEKDDSKKTILAALLESGVAWNDYVAQHPEYAPVVETPEEKKPQRPVANPNVVTSDQVSATRPRAKTREPEQFVASDTYLVKMNRENPYFEFRGYKFTKDHPFAIMDAANTNAILTVEEGFAIATPAEASEYYG